MWAPHAHTHTSRMAHLTYAHLTHRYATHLGRGSHIMLFLCDQTPHMHTSDRPLMHAHPIQTHLTPLHTFTSTHYNTHHAHTIHHTHTCSHHTRTHTSHTSKPISHLTHSHQHTPHVNTPYYTHTSHAHAYITHALILTPVVEPVGAVDEEGAYDGVEPDGQLPVDELRLRREVSVPHREQRVRVCNT